MAGDIELLIDGLREEDCTVVRTHGDGAAMDTEFMNAFAEGLVEHGLFVSSFPTWPSGYPDPLAYRQRPQLQAAQGSGWITAKAT